MCKLSLLRRFGLSIALLFISRLVVAAPNPFPMVLPWDDTQRTFTSFDTYNHKPAGRHGRITIGADGHLRAGSKRMRFFGVNVVGQACFPPKENASVIAARMAKFGINLVRCHHLDLEHFPAGIFDRDSAGNPGDTLRMNAEALDRLDYFVAELKAQGIYLNMNLLAGRRFRSADGLPGVIDSVPWSLQHLIAIYDTALIDLQKDYARQLLNRLNPYTGLTYADEPALVFVEVNNEQGLLDHWHKNGLHALPGIYGEDLRGQWNDWLAARYVSTALLRSAWSADTPLGEEVLRNADFTQGLQDWTLQIGAPAVAYAEVTSVLPADASGQSLRIDVQQRGDLDWHVQFYQAGHRVAADSAYTMTFWAKANSARSVRVGLRMDHEPWASLGLEETIALTTQWQRFHINFWTSQADDNARLEFTGMGLHTGSIWFAGASLRPGGFGGLAVHEALENRSVTLFIDKEDFIARSVPAQRDWLDFLWTTENAYYQTMRSYIKDTLRVPALLMGTQANFSPVNLMAQLDAVDTHGYWQHPLFPHGDWNPEQWTVANTSMVNARGGALPYLALLRVHGKPHSVSEYNHPAPNTFGSEGFLMLAAYAALQDWDVICAFNWDVYGTDVTAGIFPSWFEISQHTNKLATLPAAAMLFRRADVAAARKQVIAPIDRVLEMDLLRTGVYTRRWPVDASRLGIPPETTLVHRVAIAAQGQALPINALTPADVADIGTRTQFIADTGQLNWDLSVPGRGVLTVRSGNSKAIIGYTEGKEYDLANGVRVAPGASLQDGWSAISLTLKSGKWSGTHAAVLLTATGFMENTGMGWNADKSSVGSAWGVAPSLVEGIAARITLPFPAARVQVYALDERGQRKSALAVASTAEGKAEVSIGAQWQTVWYEIDYR